MQNSNRILLTIATLLSALTFFSQTTKDSLIGFNEENAVKIASEKHLGSSEYNFYFNRLKREFINHKYHLTHLENKVWQTTQTAVVQPACSNVDFETGNFNGWTVEHGSNSNSLIMGGCCAPGAGGVASVINATGNDPVFSTLSLTSPFAGTKIAKLNNTSANNKSQRISQTFNVTSSNAIFQIAFAGLLNSGGHDCIDQPYINISLKDSTGTELTCPKIEIQAPDPACIPTNTASTLGWNQTGIVSASGDVYWHDWEIKTVDLSPYIGSNITVQITVGDCTFTAHYGYAYFDCRCLPLEIDLNGNLFDATPQIPINVSTCGSTSATIIAPSGLGPYIWDGPAGSGVLGLTTQTMTTTFAGTYTLNMNPAGGCLQGGVTKYVILNVTPNPTVTTASAPATCTNATGSGTVNVTGGTYPFYYTWSPSASTSSLGVGLTPGIDYTVTVVDTFGCRSTNNIVSIPSFTDAPTYTVSPLTGYLTCLTTTISISALTGTNSVADWAHISNTIIPTPTTFVADTAGTYYCILTNTLSTCTATVPVTILSNTIAPTATPLMLCSGSTVNLNASAGAGIALGWLAPTSPASPVSNPGTSTAVGVYTLTATNLSTGCKSTYTIESAVPTVSLLTGGSTALTCLNTSVNFTAVSSDNTASITINSVAVNTLNVIAPGAVTAIATNSIGCSSQKSINVTQNIFVSAAITPVSAVLTCNTKTINLVALPATNNYTWTSTINTLSLTGNTIPITQVDTVTLFVLNAANGCTTTVGPKIISQNTLTPTATYSVLCNNFPATLSASVSNPTTAIWVAPTSPTTTIANNGTSTASGIFTVNLTNTTTGCVNSYTVSSLIPTITVSSIPISTVITCNTKTIQVAATTSPTTNITWTDGLTTVSNNPYNITASGNYTAVAAIPNGCVTTTVMSISTNTNVGVSISSPTTIISCATGTLALTANATTAGNYSYNWTPSLQTNTNTINIVSNAATYSVLALNSVNGCTAIAQQMVTHQTINASFNVDSLIGLMPLAVNFTNTSVNIAGTTYAWNFGNGGTSIDSITNTVYTTQGNYNVTLTATNGVCKDTAIKTIEVILVSFFKVPNVFTPNGDGVNDVFTFGATNMGDINFVVFDRWGKKMFETTQAGNVIWDGKNKGGHPITEGTYFYIINATGLDNQSYKTQGNINIFR